MSREAARAGWILASALTAAPLVSIFYQPIGWGPRVLAIALAITASLRPFDALLLLAGLSPFAATILALTRTGSAPLNFFEAVALAFLCGWTIRHAIRPQRLTLPARFGAAAATLLGLAIAAVVTSAIVLRIEHADAPVGELFQSFVLRNYLVASNPLSSGLLFVEGVALMIVAASLCAGESNRRQRVLGMMTLAAAAAALLNVIRIFNSAMVQPNPFTAFFFQFAALRVNMHFPDLNAAGSYFALMFFIALGFVRAVPAIASAACIAIAAGVWVAGSRTALATAFGVAAAGALLRSMPGRRRLIWSLALVVVLAVVTAIGWKWYPHGRNLDTGGAFSYRMTTGKAALELIRAHPIFGVRPGNFYEQSGLSDNAHNNYLQIAAELGVPAAMLFVYVVVFAVRAGWRHAHHSWPAWGVSLGLVAYLVTCLTGHPLLIPGAAYPFWMALGLSASFDSGQDSRRETRWGALAAALVVAATLPFQISAAVRTADIEHWSVGFSKWQQQADGSRYRWASGRATFYVSPAARSIRIPLRLGPLAPPIVEVRIFLDGIEANRVTLRTGEDATIRLNLIRRAKTRFARVDLEARVPGGAELPDVAATDAGGVLMVGRPIPES